MLHNFMLIPWIRLATLCLILPLLLTWGGCRPSQSTDPPITLQLSTWGSSEEIQVLQGLLKEFESQHPKVHVELLHIPDQYYQKLHILMAGGLTPDVVFTNSLYLPVYMAHGVFQNLNPFLSQSQTVHASDFFPKAITALTYSSQGKMVLGALPRDISNLVVYYNKTLFKKARLAEPLPQWTWQSFLKTAQALTQDQNGDGYPEQFGVSFYRTPPLFWLPFVWSAGGDLFSQNRQTFHLTDPPALQGLQFYADLRNRFHVAPQQEESGNATMSQLFLQQKLAMMMSGRWNVPVLREQARFDWDVAPLPLGPKGSRVGIDASGYAMATQTQHPQQAWELIAFLTSRHAIQQVTTSGLIVPARPDVASSPLFLSTSQHPRHSHVFVEVLDSGVPTQSVPRWNEVAEEMSLALEPVWNGKVDPQMALLPVVPKINRLLEGGRSR